MAVPHRQGLVGFVPSAILLSFLSLLVSASPTILAGQDIRYSQDPDAAKHMTLLLKDFDPTSMLHTTEHDVPRAKFPVIDVHNHVNDPGGIHGEEIAAAEVIRRMDAANVQKIVILTGMWGDKFQSVYDKMVKPFPERFIVFTQINWTR